MAALGVVTALAGRIKSKLQAADIDTATEDASNNLIHKLHNDSMKEGVLRASIATAKYSPMVLRKFSLNVSWVYLIIKQVLPT